MPNWCSNSISYTCGDNEELVVFESLINGSVVNRIDNVTSKLRKILLAGLVGVLKPTLNLTKSTEDKAKTLNPNLIAHGRGNSAQSKAYDDFLDFLVNREISSFNYHEIDLLFVRTGVCDLHWGDIPKNKRKQLKSYWRNCSYDFTGAFRADISYWWITADLPENYINENELDIRLLAELPAKVMVNGFNGGILNCGTTYNLYCGQLGSKWPQIDMFEIENGNYVFDTAWSPVIPIVHLLPSYIAKKLSKPEEELSFDCNLYYYEPGCAFQGVNDDVSDFTSTYDEETDSYEENFLPEVAEAFGIDA